MGLGTALRVSCFFGLLLTRRGGLTSCLSISHFSQCVRVYDTDKNAVKQAYSHHTDAVLDGCFMPESPNFFSGGLDKTVFS